MSWIDDLGRHLIYIFDACFAPLVYIPFNVGVFFSQKRFVSGTEMMCMGASCEHGVGGVRGRRRALVVVWSGLVWSGLVSIWCVGGRRVVRTRGVCV
jgi:hypothetical protein